MTKPLKIACIGPRGIPSNYGGIERSCEGLYSSLATMGHDITVYCRPEYVSQGSNTYRGIRLRSAFAIPTNSLGTLSHVAASLLHALSKGRFDIVHFHALAPGGFSRLCRLRGVPSVTTVHGLDWQRAKWKGLASSVLRFAERSMVRNADDVVVVSRDLQAYFRDRYSRDTVYIPNGVEIPSEAECFCVSVFERFGIVPNKYVLYVGRLVPEKRIEDLIVAFRTVKTKNKLVIAGEEKYSDPYISQLRRLATGDERVLFTGIQDRCTINGLLRNASLFVLPSQLEGLPMALLECMQQGTPAVVSDIPPHRELLGNIPGFDLFFKPGDVEGLRLCLCSGLTMVEHYRTVSQAARNYVLASHSWPTLALRTEEMFYQTIKRRYPTKARAFSVEPTIQ